MNRIRLILVAGFLAPVAAAADAGFLVDKTIVRIERSSVIPFLLPAPATEDMALPMAVRNRDVLEVLRMPRVLAGESLGFMRVRGRRAGEAALKLGSSVLAVTVEPAAGADAYLPVPPAIDGLPSGVYLWDELTAAVTFQPPDHWRESDLDGQVVLRTTGGRVLEPESITGPESGPLRRALFRVHCDLLPAGPGELVALVRRGDRHWESEPVQYFNAGRREADIRGECEAHNDIPAGDSFADVARPKTRKHKGALGGKCVAVLNKREAWVLPVTIETPGRYQLVLRVRGTPAATELPMIGISHQVPDNEVAVTAVVDEEWHRIAAGPPLELAAGSHRLICRFLNDKRFNRKSDRNLFLDAYELARWGAGFTVRDQPGSRQPDMMMAMDAMATADDDDDPGDRLAVFVDDLFDGRTSCGGLEVEGRVQWNRTVHPLPPRTSLVLNGEPIATQQDDRPLFYIPAGLWQAGRNAVALEARLPSGEIARSPLQSVQVPAKPETASLEGMIHRFSALDQRWGTTLLPYLRKHEKRGYPLNRARVPLGKTMSIDLPHDLEGMVRVGVEGGLEGKALRARWALRLDGREPGEVQYRPVRWQDGLVLGELDLPPGRKTLHLKLTRAEGRKRTAVRAVEIKALVLDIVDAHPDTRPPSVEVIYPSPGDALHGVDVVVVQAGDDRQVAWLDLVVDGVARRIEEPVEGGLGPRVLPLVMRDWPPGSHRIAVRGADEAGNETTSEAVEITVRSRAPRQPGRYGRAVRLLNRFAYGPEPALLAGILIEGERAWLTRMLSRPADHSAEQVTRARAVSRYPDPENRRAVQNRVLDHAMMTDNPVRARWVLWVENHFSTWIRKTDAFPKWREHERFFTRGVAPFADLLQASATSPAMLVYLDQHRSVAGKLNENYAREILELHTVGVDGGYSQDDVTELAHLLTGWTVTETVDPRVPDHPLVNEFRFDPSLNEEPGRRIFGLAFEPSDAGDRYQRIEVFLEALAAHPETAVHVTGKVLAHYYGLDAPEALREDVKRVYMETGGDMEAVLIAIAGHDAFWEPGLPATFMTPLDFGIRMGRLAGADRVGEIAGYLADSGMPLFGRATPDGYPEEPNEYANSNGFMQRWNLAKSQGGLIRDRIPPGLRSREAEQRENWEEQLIDRIALMLTGNMLSERSNQAAHDVLATLDMPPNRKVVEMIAFVGYLPEMNLR